MTIIVNYMAGPGAGKSTTATGVFSYLKQQGVVCEYVNEFAKELTWDEIPKLLTNQIYVFAEQFRRQYRLLDKVDLVFTDSPIFLSAVYYRFYTGKFGSKFTSDYDKELCDMFLKTFHQFKNINFYINRNKPYVATGRGQSEEEAIIIDQEVKKMLIEEQISYMVTDSQNSINDTIKHLKSLNLIDEQTV